MTLRNEKGFTLIELMAVLGPIFAIGFLLIFVFYGFIWGTLAMGNFWYTPDGVMEIIALEFPEYEEYNKVRDIRKIWNLSEFILQPEDGVKEDRVTIYLNTGVLWNYEVHETPYVPFIIRSVQFLWAGFKWVVVSIIVIVLIAIGATGFAKRKRRR